MRMLFAFVAGIELALNDSWSDDEDDDFIQSKPINAQTTSTLTSSPTPANNNPTNLEVDTLRLQLNQANLQIETLRDLIKRDFEGDDDLSRSGSGSGSGPDSGSGSEEERIVIGKGKGKQVDKVGSGKNRNQVGKKGKSGKGEKRDDDTHYFNSYASNGESLSYW